MILVIGATGPTGSEATRQLLLRGEHVRALTRDRAKAEAMPALAGAEIAVGDSSKPETLEEAFAGVEKVYLVPPTEPGWDQMQSGLIQAARDADVRHIVKMSAIGAGPKEPSMSLRFHWQGEEEVEKSGMAWTILRGNSFHQNTLFDAETIKSEGKFYSCVGETRLAKVDTRDIGEVVARVLTEEGHEAQVYELTGPESLTYHDMAHHLSRVSHHTVEYVDMPHDDYAAHLRATGFPDWLAQEFVDIYGRGFYGEGRGSYTTDTVQWILRRAPRRYDAFVHDYAEAFS